MCAYIPLSLGYMNFPPAFSVACGCRKTPPVLEWKVHSIACRQVYKNVKRRSEKESLKRQ